MKHEYVKGTDLRTIRAYMVQLLRALRYLHEEAGLVHGDIKRKCYWQWQCCLCVYYACP